MPRKARDERLDTRTARLKLTPRPEPYWRTIQQGRAIGYRRLPGGKAGSWIARRYDATEGRTYHAIGTSDDLMDADGSTSMTFAQAQDAALAWFREIERAAGRAVKPITVREAMDAYMADYLARGGKAEADVRRTISAHILPRLGDFQVARLTYAQLRAWHHGLAAAPARLRTSAKATRQNVREAADGDARRARRSSANRVLTPLKAALTFVYREGRVPSDDAWRRLKPFQNVDAPRICYLTDDEALRLVNACAPDFRTLVTAALLTGCRYGELTRLRAADFDPEAGVLMIREAKAGARAVPLIEEAQRHFAALAAGKAGDALLLARTDGEPWGESHQHRHIQMACAAARIEPAVSFHVLRHSFASRFLRRGVAMSVVAAALGNSEAICAKHYAHLAPNYVAMALRAAAGDQGLVPRSSVVTPIRAAG
jgi:site-specific recombinase XerD